MIAETREISPERVSSVLAADVAAWIALWDGHLPACDPMAGEWVLSAEDSRKFYAWAEAHGEYGPVTKSQRWAHVKRLHHERLRLAMPPWADKDALRAIYAEARRLTQQTGEPHEVDHEVPLLGKHVSGLHVEYNLRVVPRAVNRRKSNRV